MGGGGKSEISFPFRLSSLSRAGKALFLRMFLQRFLQRAADTPTGGGARSICLTGVIESVSNYYSNWRACFTVELPVKQVGRKPEPVKARQSKETRSVGLMDFSTPLCLRTQRSRQGGDWGVGRGGRRMGRLRINASSCASGQETRWTFSDGPSGPWFQVEKGSDHL